MNICVQLAARWRRGSTGGGLAGAPCAKLRRSKSAKPPLPLLSIEKQDRPAEAAERVKRVRMDGQATGHMGPFARGGHTRGHHQASAPALGCKETSLPWGLGDEDPAPLSGTCGRSSQTSAVIVETLPAGGPG
jgi:hypothetical protein